MKEKIIFSLTCHESKDCVFDLIENIKICFSKFDIFILISCTDNINLELESQLNPQDGKVITVRQINNNIWGNIDLIHQHMINMKYLKDNNINYDYFWFVASNEYFFKIVTPEHIKQYLFNTDEPNEFTDKEINQFYNDFNKTNHSWFWFNLIKNDKYTMSKLKENKIKLYGNAHEGTVLPYKVANELLDLYYDMDINNKSDFKGYTLEEMLMPSFVRSKYKIKDYNTFCMHIYGKYNGLTEEQIFQKLMEEPKVLSIKPIIRDYNNKLRTVIRNNLKIEQFFIV